MLIDVNTLVKKPIEHKTFYILEKKKKKKHKRYVSIKICLRSFTNLFIFSVQDNN